MPLIRKTFNTISFASILYFASCNGVNSMNIEGQLIYIVRGGNVDAITFSASEYSFSSVYESKVVAAINHLTRENGNAILFDECIRGKCSIKRYSMKRGQVTLLNSGRLPSYMPSHDKLFFYDKASDNDNWLFVTTLKDINKATKVAKEPKWKMLPNGISQPITIAVIQISSDEIIFVGEDEHLWQYDVANKKLTSLNIGNCRPILWRERHNQLLCSDWDTRVPFLLDMDSKDKSEMPELEGAYGFVYIPSSDSLIYGRTRSKFLIGEAYDLFFYSFADKKEKRIRKDLHITDGIWIEKANAN